MFVAPCTCPVLEYRCLYKPCPGPPLQCRRFLLWIDATTPLSSTMIKSLLSAAALAAVGLAMPQEYTPAQLLVIRCRRILAALSSWIFLEHICLGIIKTAVIINPYQNRFLTKTYCKQRLNVDSPTPGSTRRSPRPTCPACSSPSPAGTSIR